MRIRIRCKAEPPRKCGPATLVHMPGLSDTEIALVDDDGSEHDLLGVTEVTWTARSDGEPATAFLTVRGVEVNVEGVQPMALACGDVKAGQCIVVCEVCGNYKRAGAEHVDPARETEEAADRLGSPPPASSPPHPRPSEACPMGVGRPTIPGWRAHDPCSLPRDHAGDCEARPAASLVPLPPGLVLVNGGRRCDMAVGPCSCGATHEWSEDRPIHAKWEGQRTTEPLPEAYVCPKCGVGNEHDAIRCRVCGSYRAFRGDPCPDYPLPRDANAEIRAAVFACRHCGDVYTGAPLEPCGGNHCHVWEPKT